MTNCVSTGGPRVSISDTITLYQRGRRGTWTADFHWTGQHCRRSLDTRNRKIAEQRARDLETKLSNEGYEPRLRPVAISDAIKEYLEAMGTKGLARKSQVKYAGELKNFAAFAKDRGVMTVPQITLRLHDAYMKHRKDADGLAGYTLFNHAVIHKTWVKWCRRRKLIAADPLADLELPKPKRPRHPAATLDQVNAILGSAAGQDLAVLATAAFTGLRIGEVAALRPQDVDLKGGWVHVRSREGWGPKTENSARSVPIHPRLAAILAAGAGDRRKGLTFFTRPQGPPSDQGYGPINPRTVNVLFQALARRHGADVGRDQGGLTLHSLRRFFKTFTLNSRVPKPMVDGWMGHQDSEDMDTFYYDSSQSKQLMDSVPFGQPNAQ